MLGKDVMVIPSLPSHLVIHFGFQINFSTGKQSSKSHGEVIQMWVANERYLMYLHFVEKLQHELPCIVGVGVAQS